MSPLPNIKVRKDDERLAHGVVASRTDELFDEVTRSKAVRSFMAVKSASALIDMLKRSYGVRLVWLITGKLTGSRAKVDALIAEPMSNGDYCLGLIIWRGDLTNHVRMRRLGLTVTRHAVARAVHRTVGSGDVDQAVATIFRPLVAWVRSGTQEDHGRAKRIIIRGFGGELRCVVDASGLTVKTWIDAGSLPDWKHASAMADEYTEEIFFE